MIYFQILKRTFNFIPFQFNFYIQNNGIHDIFDIHE